jgi:exonuclease III
MKTNNTIEIILASKNSLNSACQKELADWLATTVQAVIEKQELKTKKIFFRPFKNSPVIYMS